MNGHDDETRSWQGGRDYGWRGADGGRTGENWRASDRPRDENYDYSWRTEPYRGPGFNIGYSRGGTGAGGYGGRDMRYEPWGGDYGRGGNYGENWRGQQGNLAPSMNRDYGQRSGQGYYQGGQGSNENWRNWGQGGYGEPWEDAGRMNYGRESSWQDWRGQDWRGSAPNWGNAGYERSRGNWGDEQMGRWSGASSGWSEGPHAGRGPRGYRRSDDRICEEVNDRLTAHSWLDASELDVEVHDGVVTLKGDVDSRQQKRLAEDVAESISGVRDVNNLLRVHDHEQSLQGTSSMQGGEAGQASGGSTSASRNDRVTTRT